LCKSDHQLSLKLSDLKNSGHWPTLLTAFLYFDFSFMVWTVLGPLGAQIGESLNLRPDQKGFMVAMPILSGAILRILLGLLVDRIGAKNTGVIAQLIVILGLAVGYLFGLANFQAALALGLVLGFAGASFAVALPQAGRWYPPEMQGVVMGLAGAGNIGVVLDSLLNHKNHILCGPSSMVRASAYREAGPYCDEFGIAGDLESAG